mmetsp:Transcript_19897/g.30235  ORF Transcript_19897/g.30235 Transcript_19897/m.30235 type:complete len:151 (+) Transcript_19897:1131-1583(+)
MTFLDEKLASAWKKIERAVIVSTWFDLQKIRNNDKQTFECVAYDERWDKTCIILYHCNRPRYLLGHECSGSLDGVSNEQIFEGLRSLFIWSQVLQNPKKFSSTGKELLLPVVQNCAGCNTKRLFNGTRATFPWLMLGPCAPRSRSLYFLH